jgi:two-component system KDP operon response regulator KdpE
MPQPREISTPQHAPLVLIVEDDPRMCTLLRGVLCANGLRTLEAGSLSDGLELARSALPEMIIVDLGLPDGNGADLIRGVRQWSSMPIFVLSGCNRLQEKVAGLNAGADDYVTKPFAPQEFIARVRASLRRSTARNRSVAGSSFATGELRVDRIRRVVTVGGRKIALTPTEYRLLVELVNQAGSVVTHERLLAKVWGPSKIGCIHYVHIYMTQLRRKVEPDPMNPLYLLTETGIGYRLATH